MFMVQQLTSEWVGSRLPRRPKDANKGTFGKVLAIAGSENYPGAAYLACAACYRVGAGLITLVTTATVEIIVSKKLPEVTFLSFNEVFEKLNSYDVLLVGPGLGQKEQIVKLVEKLIKEKLPKTVVDGDGLNIISKIENWWERLGSDTVLTPHPGEMSRLTGLSIDEIQLDRANTAKKFSRKWNKIVVLKGANTVIASPAGETGLSPFANSLLSTAGTGDVLSGIIAGFVAQRLKPFDAACLGVYLHGLVGEMLREKFGKAGILASDLLPILPQALLHISKHWVS